MIPSDQSDHPREDGKVDNVTVKVEEPEADEGLEHITEGYVSWFKAMYEWTKAMDTFHSGVIQSLLKPTALVMPEHPLRLPEEEGIVLYHTIETEGKERLCFSLAQLQYLQYYVLEHQKADPSWLAKLCHLGLDGALGCDAESQDCVDAVRQLEGARLPEHLPLPSEWYLPSRFVSIEPVFFVNGQTIKAYNSRLARKNKQAAKRLLQVHMTEIEKARESARIENDMPGPGLRRGGQRFLNSRPREELREEDWPETPLLVPPHADRASPTAATPASAPLDSVVDPAVGLPTPPDSNSATSETPNVEMDDESSTLVGKLIDAKYSAEGSPSATAPQVKAGNTFSVDYFEHAEQAVAVAALGGVAEVLKRRATEAEPADAELSPEPADLPHTPEGKSLFCALVVDVSQEDPEVVLGVGWAAMWWQRSLEGADSEEYGLTEDCGHFKVQDHILDKRLNQPDGGVQARYQFGASLPIAKKDLQQTVKQLINDLHVKAGGGPIYMVNHSTSQDSFGPTKIGFNTNEWIASFKPPGWEYPTYTDSRGIGRSCKIDTAMLYAAVEFGDDPPVPLRTSKSLGEVVKVLSGDEVPGLGHAGNEAFYTLQVFKTLTSGIPLPRVREAVRAGGPVKWQPEVATPLSTLSDDSQAAVCMPPEWQKTLDALKGLREAHALEKEVEAEGNEVEKPTVGTDTAQSAQRDTYHGGMEEDDEDSEDDMIAGVGYEDDDGNMVWLHKNGSEDG